MVNVPPLLFKIPPPKLFCPFLIVRSEIVTGPIDVTWKASLAAFALIVSTLAPGPLIITRTFTRNSPVVSVITPEMPVASIVSPSFAIASA
ncbi:MAG: hypothetical protein DMF10_09790 [Verrucomicrobia bacterium]|nr:MAG: hypothetical protein DMF10_09790 [Verrucomicrobiota bacterium]